MSAQTPQPPQAQDVMQRHVKTVPPEMSLADVVGYLIKHEISVAPVLKEMDGKQQLVGLVSEGDCLEYLSNEMFFGAPSQPQRAETIMKRHLVCVHPEDDVFTLASVMTNHRYRHVPVVDGERMVGIVSQREVLKAIREYYRKWASEYEHEHFPVNLHELMNLRFLGSRK